MEFKVEGTVTSVGLKIILLCAFISVSVSQLVMVEMTKPEYESNPVTASAKLTCDFSVDDKTYTLNNLEWRIDGSLVADFYGGALDPAYHNYCLSSGDCNITRNNGQSDFVISSLNIEFNSKAFSCQVTFLKDANIMTSQGSAELIVVVPVNTIKMSNESSSEEFTYGSKVDLSLDVPSHIFQCEVAGINPQATFTWTVGGETLSSDSITKIHVVDSVPDLTTSTSYATLTPYQKYNDTALICKAVNYEGDPGVMFSLVLKVANPCDNYEKCMNGGTCVIDTSDPSKIECDCAYGYKGEFCGEGPLAELPYWVIVVVPAIVCVTIAIHIVRVCWFCKRQRGSHHESDTPMK